MIADLHINKILENISDSRGSHDVSDHYVCYFSKFANLFFDFLPNPKLNSCCFLHQLVIM